MRYRRQSGNLATSSTLVPPECSLLHIGINSVTKRLESMIRNPTVPNDHVPVVFICKRDVLPQQIGLHILTMTALARVKLVQLPAEAQKPISIALRRGTTQLSMMLVELACSSELVNFRQDVECVPSVDAKWLSQSGYEQFNTKVIISKSQ
ncbi:hypothetical protein DM01DRAFT_1339647 [Hesseltinella vesiculosa]|uniref:Uncharacterized protein n=1 Tax=Hesseltinella vesiculosa TaxID=101127 RepID=A0A1X2G6J3_9FUNG|nr:hypothetical protein DM01DRAFT_1339647 [Hesseltinella vesiculosa]